MHRPILSFRHAPRLQRALPLAAGLALALPLGAGALAAPAASAATTSCLVVDVNSDHSYTSLQDAVNDPATAPGDTLFVKGTCTGSTDITENLTVTGQSNGAQKTATLNGGGQGSVLRIEPGVTVTLNALVITGGGNPASAGGGIFNEGTVTLNNSTVTGNRISAGNGGAGIFNDGTVILNNSTVTGNTANNDQSGGGGIYNRKGTVTLAGSSTVTGNSATGALSGGGGGILNCATLVNAIAPPAANANVYNNQPDDILNAQGCSG